MMPRLKLKRPLEDLRQFSAKSAFFAYEQEVLQSITQEESERRRKYDERKRSKERKARRRRARTEARASQ